MLRKRKIKPREQRTAEEFFPVDVDDVKRATEKIVKPMPPTTIIVAKNTNETVETAGKNVDEVLKLNKKLPKKRVSVKRLRVKSLNDKSASKTNQFSSPNITLKQNGYELIITEKPQAAAKIANALGNPSTKSLKGVSYYELTRQDTGKKIIVACAVGHLFTLKQNNETRGQLPAFDISWVPNYMARSSKGKTDFTKKYYETLSSLSKNAGSVTVATDYDIEGEVIGLNVVRFVTGQKDANRMKFSTLTEKELNEAYETKAVTLDWGQAIAGETRHYLDWYYGINLSRALMKAIKSTGKFKIMSIGRVQGPALNLIVKKEREIMAFKPKPYWQIFINLSNKTKPEVELKYVKDIFNKKDIDNFKNLEGETVLVSTEKSQQTIAPS
ncbi:MAG: DNA topoisomerase, partial [Candidatus Pacearchaeota archaeon]